MGRKSQRGVSQLSAKSSDKLMAALNCWSTPRPDMPLSDYQAACHRWRNMMTPDEREALLVVVDAYAGPHRHDAEGLAGQSAERAEVSRRLTSVIAAWIAS